LTSPITLPNPFSPLQTQILRPFPAAFATPYKNPNQNNVRRRECYHNGRKMTQTKYIKGQI